MLPQSKPLVWQNSANKKRLKKLFDCTEYFENMTGNLENGNEKIVIPGDQIKDARKKGLPWLIAAFVVVIFVLLILVLLFVIRDYVAETNISSNSALKSIKDLTSNDWPKLSKNTLEANFKKVSIVSDNGLCSEIGRNVLLSGGNAIDSAVATIICIGGVNLHSSGLGGGLMVTMYRKRDMKCTVVDARETAPIATNENTFINNPQDAFTGYKSIATPGELHGLWTTYKRYASGRIAWQDLIMPTVNLLKNGYPTTKLMELNLEATKDDIWNEPTMRNFFINNQTNELYKEGEIIKNPILAETLRKLAVSVNPVEMFYEGEMAQQIATEIFGNNGYLTKRDLEHYRSIIDDHPIETQFTDSLTICGPKPPSGFAVMQFIVGVMSKLYPKGSDSETIFKDDEFYHRFVEAQKYGYADRASLADLRFQPNATLTSAKLTNETYIQEVADKIKASTKSQEPSEYGTQQDQPGTYGTSHVSVVDAEGNAVSITSTINNRFGSRRRSESLGIIWNDEMDDFSIPGAKNFYGFEPAKANFMAPGKRPMSSMSPAIIYDKSSGIVKASIGASGGSKIISAMAQFILFNVNFNATIKEAIDFPRIHNQFTPFNTFYEKGFPQVLLEALEEKGHNMTKYEFPFATIQAIVRNPDGSLSAGTDYRRPIYMNPAGY